jgi:hypothetical protein
MPPTIIVPGSTIGGTAMAASRHLPSSVTRDEALSLYRDILRTAKAFHWCDERGTPWRERLRIEARKEYEISRNENDPLIVARMIVTGRECVMEVRRKFNEADRRCMERIQRESANKDGGGGGGGGGGN